MSQALQTETFDTDIAVVGMAGRFPGSSDIDGYWKNLKSGVDSLTTFSDEELRAAGVSQAQLNDPAYVRRGAVFPDVAGFDANFFGFSPREASIMDPQHRHFIEVAWQALENAGYDPQRFEGAIGVFGGSGHNAYMPYNLLTNPKLMDSVGFFLVRHTGNDKDFLTTRVSYLLNLRGPSVNVQTACSTSLVAIHTAVQSLLNGECDMALAGGVTIELPHGRGYVYQEGEILSSDGYCRAFDASSQGTVFGSACGVVVLRRLQDAVVAGDHIYAVIKGSAINNDGSGKVGYLAPSVDGQARVIAEALDLAKVSPETISYVETHGTGTPVGDPIEVSALTQAFRQGTQRTGFCAIGSVKSNIGHTDTAAGVASFIKVALSLQHRELPASLHFTSPNPSCQFESSPFYVNDRLTPWASSGPSPRRAGVSSLGVGGTNAHCILEEAAPRPSSGPSPRHQHLLLVSAKTSSALKRRTQALCEFLSAHPQVNLADVAYTLQVGRTEMGWRRWLVGASAAEIVASTEGADDRHTPHETAAGLEREVVFMFAGGGAQYPGMGRDLYESEPVYKAALDECLTILSRVDPSLDFRSALFPSGVQGASVEEALTRPALALPCLLATQIAQARLWISWGVVPKAMLGHSMGEYTAAHLSGVFGLEAVLRLVSLRGRLFESLPDGAMLSVPLSEAQTQPYLHAGLCIAAVNAPSLTVVSGPVEAIDRLAQRLSEAEIEASRIKISVAAHSSMLDPILDEFGSLLRTLQILPPKIPLISNVSGTWLTPEEAVDPQYWVTHLRQTVQFAQGVQTLLSRSTPVALLEVGPGRTLTSLSRQHPLCTPSVAVMNSIRHPDEKMSDAAFMMGAMGRLWAAGAKIDWTAFWKGQRRQRVPLPAYPFEHQTYWIEPGQPASSADVGSSLARRDDVGQWFYTPQWKAKPLLIKPAVASLTDAVAQPSGSAAQRPWIFFVAHPLCERLVEALIQHHQSPVLILPGSTGTRSTNRWGLTQHALDLDDPRAIEQLFLESPEPPSRIYHFWLLTPRNEAWPEDLAGLDKARKLGFDTLLHLAKAVAQVELPDEWNWCVVTNDAQSVNEDGSVVASKATIAGPVKVIPREIPGLRMKWIDVADVAPGSYREGLYLQQLTQEFELEPNEDVVAYRGSSRWVRRYEQTSVLQATDTLPSRLKPNGTYLITGGLGGLGLAVAAQLATLVQGQLILVSRTALPLRSSWLELLQSDQRNGPVAQRVRQVLALEEMGAKVLVLTVDVSQEPPLRNALKSAIQQFGPITGVFHAAGVLQDGLIGLKEDSAVDDVWAPKVEGTLALSRALKLAQPEVQPEFVVLFSSISAFAGLAGQIDYASANAFLDAFAQQTASQDGPYTVSINWSQWQEIGMAANLAESLGMVHQGSAVEHPIIQRCYRDSLLLREYGSTLSAKNHWLLGEHRVREGAYLMPGTGFLELVRAAYTLRVPSRKQMLELRDVGFLSPFSVSESEAREIRVRFEGPSFVVLGRPAQAPDGPWVEHVRGDIRSITFDEVVPTLALDQIRLHCAEPHELNPFDSPQLAFGPRWNNVRSIHRARDQALVHQVLPESFRSDFDSMDLHPSLLDFATAGAQFLIPGYVAGQSFFVPASYGLLKHYAALPPEIFSHIRFTGDRGSKGAVAAFDIVIADPQGRILVAIQDFTMIEVKDRSLLSSSDAQRRSQMAANHKTPVANDLLALGLKEGIRTREGIDALTRVLAYGLAPQVVVSPQDLSATIQAGRTEKSAARAKPQNRPDGQAETPPEGRPRTEFERFIAKMWEDMLGVSDLSIHANFFDMGGHSLLALQVINKIKRRTGTALPLTALLEAPTVAELAALAEPHPESEPSQPDASVEGSGAGLVAQTTAVRSRGPRSKTVIQIASAKGQAAHPPLFLIHDGNGETLLYRNLALMLRPDQDIFGLQPEIRSDGAVVHTTIPAMAAAHVRSVRQLQAHGPYYFAGLCAGGVIAFEMARQLQEQGEVTAFVGIMDGADVEAAERSFRTTTARVQGLKQALAPKSKRHVLEYLRQMIPTLYRKARNVLTYEFRSRTTIWRNSRKVRLLREHLMHPEVRLPAPWDLSYLIVYEYSFKEYRPAGTLKQGHVVVFRAQQSDGNDMDIPYILKYEDPLLGWQCRVAEAVHAEDVPGGHSSMLQEPHVGILSVKLQHHLDVSRRKLSLTMAEDKKSEDRQSH